MRCDAVKVEDGRRCRRNAGGGTDHPGEGPCARHDDGSWRRAAFADDEGARQAFLEAVRATPAAPIRELIEPLGFHKRDVTDLASSDAEFEDAYVEARGYDPEAIRAELRKRAFTGGSDRLLEFIAKMRLPEAKELQRMRIDGRIEVQAIVASPEWVELRDRVLAALRPFPDALDAVLAALGVTGDESQERRELAA